MFKSKKQLSFSTEKIADSYLAELAKYDGEKQTPFLDAFLRRQNIYMDIEKIEGAIHILRLNKLTEVESTGGKSIFTYVSEANPENLTGHVTAIPRMRITAKGIHFVKGGQELDEKGKMARAEAAEKRKDKRISAGISFGVAVLTMFIKWFFFDRK